MPDGVLIAVIVLAVVGAGAWFLSRRKDEESDGEGADIQDVLESLDRTLGIPPSRATFWSQNDRTTPMGARIRSTVPVPDAALATIDAALVQLQRRYKNRYPDWIYGFRHDSYDLLFVDPNGQIDEGEPKGAPTITVQGTESAGSCIPARYGGFPMDYIVLPHQAGGNWQWADYLFNSVYNEGEHYIESLNSRGVFNTGLGSMDTHPRTGPEWDTYGGTESEFVSFMAKPRTVRQKTNCGVKPYGGEANNA